MASQYYKKTTPGSKQAVCCYCPVASLCLAQDLEYTERIQLSNIITESYQVNSGSIVVSPGSTSHALYAVRQGSFKEYTLDKNGEETVVDFYFPGEIIGLSALSQNKHSYFVEALEGSTICEIDLKKLFLLMTQNKHLQERLFAMMSQKLLAQNLLNVCQDAEQKVLSFLVNLADRFQERGKDNYAYTLSMSRYDIANYLRLRTETVSRTFTKLKKQGLIHIQNKYIHLNKLNILKNRTQIYAN